MQQADQKLKEDTVTIKYHQQSFKKIIEEVKPLVPADFHFSANEKENSFTVLCNNFLICNLSNSIGSGKIRKTQGISVMDVSVKKENTKYINYQVKYIFKPQYTPRQQQQLQSFNDSIDAAIIGLGKKYTNSDRWRTVTVYTPATKADEKEYKAYNREEDSLRKMAKKFPDFDAGGYSIFITDNLPEYYILFDDNSSKINQLKRNIQATLTGKEN